MANTFISALLALHVAGVSAMPPERLGDYILAAGAINIFAWGMKRAWRAFWFA